ncbi:hypothetical protein [Ilumatobacter sp.]|uniref:hypothetical protein n=1 Tax=Ilumatobacter sp. TaxID=1967498 RepID=UPI003B522BDE
MITTGSKFLIGAAVLATVAAVVYGISQDGVMGTVGLASAAVVLAGLAVLDLVLRDSNVFVDDDSPASLVESSAAAQRAPSASVWPLALAFGAVVVVVGLVSYQPIVVIGLVVVFAAGAEWAVQAWSEGASGSVERNAEVRSRLSNPFEYPVGGAVAIGIVVYAFSRVMLWLSKTNTVIAFSVLALIVLIVAFGFALRPSVKTGAMGGVLAIGAVLVVAAGAAAGLDGERTIPEFETTAIWQEEANLHPEEYAEGAEEGEHPAEPICESPEEFPEADEDVSQTVGLKSNSIEIVLTSEGTLSYDLPGPVPDADTALTLQRSNATNIIFRNEYSEHARLSLDLGTTTTEVEAEDGGESTELEYRDQLCTTLIEEGGAQLLTIVVDQPSADFADDNPNGDGPGYWFFVPGVDSATLEVRVP